MSIRSFFGLCEHRWQDTGERITTWARRRHPLTVEQAEREICVGISHVQRCTKCGLVRSAAL